MTSRPGRKQIHFDIPISVFEEFHRLFPGKGERSTFLRKMIAHAISFKKDTFAERLREQLKRDMESWEKPDE